MITQIFLGTVLISITVVIHAIGTISVVPKIHAATDWIFTSRGEVYRVFYTIQVVLWLFLLHTAEIWIWAVTYWRLTSLTHLPDLEAALYFSTVCFTTLGFGDVVLDKDWRILSALQASNGILLFGWSSAFLFTVVRQTWDSSMSASADS